MGAFSNKSAIGLTWSATGRCCGVLLRRKGDQVRVESAWAEDAGGGAVSSALALVRSRLGADGGAYLIAGNADCRAGLVDLHMPALPAADLYNALQFELARVSPVAVEKLVWGYRLLDGEAGGRQRVRVADLRESEWAKWIEDLSGLEGGVDQIIPPPAVLDPLLSAQSVFFPASEVAGGFCFRMTESGLREMVFEPPPVDSEPAPLAISGVEPGPLAERPAEEQNDFLPAILLALYGLGHSWSHDRHTWLPVPYELRPRRHRYSRLIAYCLATVAVLFLAIGLGREVSAAKTYYDAVRQECASLKTVIGQLRQGQESAEAIQTLRTELKEAKLDRPTLPECLLELTRLSDDEVWVRFLNWNDGKIEVEFSSAKHDLDLLEKLETSPILLDVVPQSRVIDPKNVLTLRMQMYAGYKGQAQAADVEEGP